MGRYLEPDPLAMEGLFNGEYGPDWYGYANQNPLHWADVDGLLPSPTGPYHPPGRYNTPSCKASDDCPTIAEKMIELQAMIASHTMWDANVPKPNGGSRHKKEIVILWGNYASCQYMYQWKCPNHSCDSKCKTVLVGIGVTAAICVAPEGAPIWLSAAAAGL